MMQGTAAYAPVLEHIAEIGSAGEFTLVDIGCSGGIDPIWRRFGRRLRAVCFDPNLGEIERLKAAETHSGVQYVGAFAVLPAEHPFAKKKTGRADVGRNPWGRLSTARSREISGSRNLSNAEKTRANFWPEVELASETIVVPEYLRKIGIESVDFVKIDIDGKDFDVLHSLDSALEALGVLGLGLEVMFFGTAIETDHTFHNTDRFLKARGFELFNLIPYRYSLASLPSQYLYTIPSATKFGRILWADALYIRDLGSAEHQEFAARLSPTKILNLVGLFAAHNLPDCAAEIALVHRERLSPLCQVDRVFDLLAEQAQPGTRKPLTYRQYMNRFEAQDAMFFPGGIHRLARYLVPRILRRPLRRLWRAWEAWREA